MSLSPTPTTGSNAPLSTLAGAAEAEEAQIPAPSPAEEAPNTPSDLASKIEEMSQAIQGLSEKVNAFATRLSNLESFAIPGVTEPTRQAFLHNEKAFALNELNKFKEALQAAKDGLAIPGVTDPNLQASLHRWKALALIRLLAQPISSVYIIPIINSCD